VTRVLVSDERVRELAEVALERAGRYHEQLGLWLRVIRGSDDEGEMRHDDGSVRPALVRGDDATNEFEMVLYLPVVSRAPDDAVVGVIAHELAHVVDSMELGARPTGNDVFDGFEESFTDSIAAGMGFERELEAWSEWQRRRGESGERDH